MIKVIADGVVGILHSIDYKKKTATVTEIAELRGCTHQSVSQTLRNVKEKYNIQEVI